VARPPLMGSEALATQEKGSGSPFTPAKDTSF